MPIINVKNKLEEYRIRASKADINEMTGRTNNPELSKYVLNNIAEKVSSFEGTFVDIGCGDGSLFKLIEKKIKHKNNNYIGILPTKEECNRLKENIKRESNSRVEIRKGISKSLPCDKNIADVVIINGVLLILENKEEVIESIKEIQRICKNNAIVFFGEIPFVDEMKNIQYGDSIIKWLFSKFFENGLKTFFLKLKYTLRCLISDEIFLITNKRILWFEINEFKEILESLNFKILDLKKHKEINSSRKETISKTRANYLAQLIN